MKLLHATAAIKHWQEYFDLHRGDLLFTLKTPSARSAPLARFHAIQVLRNLNKLPNVKIESATGIYNHHNLPNRRYIKLILSTSDDTASALLNTQTHKLTMTKITDRQLLNRLLALGIGCSDDISDVIAINHQDLKQIPKNRALGAPSVDKRSLTLTLGRVHFK